MGLEWAPIEFWKLVFLDPPTAQIVPSNHPGWRVSSEHVENWNSGALWFSKNCALVLRVCWRELKNSLFPSDTPIYGISCDNSKKFYTALVSTWSKVQGPRSARWEPVPRFMQPCPSWVTQYKILGGGKISKYKIQSGEKLWGNKIQNEGKRGQSKKN